MAQQRSRKLASLEQIFSHHLAFPTFRAVYMQRLNSELYILILGFAIYKIADNCESCPLSAPLFMLSFSSFTLLPSFSPLHKTVKISYDKFC